MFRVRESYVKLTESLCYVAGLCTRHEQELCALSCHPQIPLPFGGAEMDPGSVHSLEFSVLKYRYLKPALIFLLLAQGWNGRYAFRMTTVCVQLVEFCRTLSQHGAQWTLRVTPGVRASQRLCSVCVAMGGWHSMPVCNEQVLCPWANLPLPPVLPFPLNIFEF